MANLVIDIGNTSTKVAVFENSQLVHNNQYSLINEDAIRDVLRHFAIKTAIVCDVKNTDQPDWLALLGSKIKLIHFTNKLNGGISNKYLTPDTLGTDRLAAVIGANTLFPQQNNLVIDGGTCITYDFIDAGGNYLGGSISPGLNMRYKALNYYTGALPLYNADINFDGYFGDNTASAIKSGVQNGIKYEIAGFIESYRKQAQELNITLCGGDSIFFDTLLKNSIFAPYIKIEPHLVLKGLNAAIHNNND